MFEINVLLFNPLLEIEFFLSTTIVKSVCQIFPISLRKTGFTTFR